MNGKLKTYVDRLLPVLHQFTQTYKGHASAHFWNNLYHERAPNRMEYGAQTMINGWVIRFFSIKEALDEEMNIEQMSIPIKLTNMLTGKETQLHLVGGCRGVSVEDKNVYRPHMSYAIIEKVEKKTKK